MGKKKISICFVLPALNAGGAQRILSFLAKSIDRSKFDCTLLVIGKPHANDFDVKGIKVHYFKKDRLLAAAKPLFKYFYRKKPNIVLGSIGHVSKLHSLYSFFLKDTKFIMREASMHSIMNLYNKSTHITSFNYLYKDYRKSFVKVICQSKDMADYMVKDHNIPRNKLCIINNPLTIEPKVKSPVSSNDPIKKLITIGRLSKEKGHERILNILTKLEIDWHYTIIGTGNETDNLKAQVRNLKLEKQVTFIPHTNEVTNFLSSSDLFLQGSYVEGFPNATMESCAIGTPVVAFEAPGGTKEILINDINGYIAKNEDEYLNFVRRSLTDKKWDVNIISKSITDRFNGQIIIKKYEDLFLEIANLK